MLDVLPRDLWINLQIKRGEPVAAEAVRAIVRAGRLDQAFLACGDAAGREARAEHAEVLLCNLARQRTRDAYVDHAIATGSRFIQFHFLRGLPSPEQLQRVGDAGLCSIFFCDPAGSHLEQLFGLGVDFVLVDDVPAALSVARGFGIEPVRRPQA